MRPVHGDGLNSFCSRVGSHAGEENGSASRQDNGIALQHFVASRIQRHQLSGRAALLRYNPERAITAVYDLVRTPGDAAGDVRTRSNHGALLVGQRELSNLRVAEDKRHTLAVGGERNGVRAWCVADCDRVRPVKLSNVQSAHPISNGDHRNREAIRREREATLQSGNRFRLGWINDIETHHARRGFVDGAMREGPQREDDCRDSHCPGQDAPSWLNLAKGRGGHRRRFEWIVEVEPRVPDVAQPALFIFRQAPVVRKNSVRLPCDRDVGTYLFGLRDLENPGSQFGGRKYPSA